MAANQFVTNFRQAANPQIVKKYASGDYEGSKKLLLQSTKFSFFMMLMIALPVCVLAKPLLTLWLGLVPDYTVSFLQLVVIQSLFQVFDTSFYTALYAKGQLKENALISPTFLFVCFPIIYWLFKIGCSPLALSWASLLTYVILAIVVKPLLIIKIVDYKWSEIWQVFKPCIWVSIVSIPFPVYLSIIVDTSNSVNFILVALITVLVVVISSYYIGLNKEVRNKLQKIILSKIRR